jgi:ABC-type bacteriocin/lantibiotic exporter with double-glycine peptidase domain
VKLLEFPETRQVFSFDCGASSLVSMLVYSGIDEREDRIAALAGTTRSGTNVAGVVRVFSYYGLPFRIGSRMKAADLRAAVDQGCPVLIAIQAYRESGQPYTKLWGDGHWVVAIGYDERRIYFDDPSSFHRTWLADEELHQRWHDLDAGGRRLHGWGCTLLVAGVYQPLFCSHMD